MNKKCFFAALLFMASSAVMADDYNFLTVEYGADGVSSVSLPTIQKIYFSEGNCVVATTDGKTYTYPISEMKKITFTAEDIETAIKTMPEEAENLKFQDGKLNVKGSGFIHIYNAKGMLVNMAHINENACINLDNLPHGIYIVNMGDKSIKVSK